MKVEQKKLPKSQIELEFELTAEEFAEQTKHAVEHLKGHVKVDGFRHGQAPAKLVEDKIKPEVLLMEAGADETKVSIDKNVVRMMGKDMTENERRYTDLDLAVDKFLRVLLNESVKRE